MASNIPEQSGIRGSVEVRFQGQVAVVQLKRGENRINDSFFDEYNRALDEVERYRVSVHICQTVLAAKAISIQASRVCWSVSLNCLPRSCDKDNSSRYRNAKARVLVTTGDGKFYSNGLDLDWIVPSISTQNYGPTFHKKWTEFIIRLLTFPMPTVAALNGTCSFLVWQQLFVIYKH